MIFNAYNVYVHRKRFDLDQFFNSINFNTKPDIFSRPISLRYLSQWQFLKKKTKKDKFNIDKIDFWFEFKKNVAIITVQKSVGYMHATVYGAGAVIIDIYTSSVFPLTAANPPNTDDTR